MPKCGHIALAGRPNVGKSSLLNTLIGQHLALVSPKAQATRLPVTGRFIDLMHADEAKLGVLPPTHEPRATQFVPGMVQMIQTLIDKDLAYPAPNGDVYYAVHRFAGYGKLSGKSLEDLRAGERVEVDPNKREPLDFGPARMWSSMVANSRACTGS